jgi:hypothetical protein
VKPQTRVTRPRMSPEELGAAQRAAQADCEFFQNTRHCGQCGRPGVTCSCTGAEPCGCWLLHGGNRNRDAQVEMIPMFEDAGPRKIKHYERGS